MRLRRKFKYQINHFISIQPRNINVDDLAIKLREVHAIPPHIFDRDRRLQEGELYEIPEVRLKIYAQLLHVSVSALVEEHTERYACK